MPNFSEGNRLDRFSQSCCNRKEIPNRHAKYYPGFAAYRVSVKRKTRPSHSGNIQWLQRYYYISENSAYRSVSKPSISESIAPLDIPQARRYFSFHPQLPGESAPEPRRRHRPKSPSAVPGNKAGHLRNSRARPLPMIRHLRFSYTIYRENFRTKGCCRSSFSNWQPMPAKCPHPASSLRFCFPLPVPQRRSGRMPKKKSRGRSS